MRLLIVTQAVDTEDPVLGFFHRWIEEFAKHASQTNVICLKEGAHELPHNVRVHSLGKEGGRSRIKYIVRLFRYAWTLRNEYDAVYVHMNQEYVLLCGVLWRMLGKRIVLWRNHKVGSGSTNLAGKIADTVCYTSEAAYVASFQNAVRMPIGIDTTTFRPGTNDARQILFLGRLDKVKNVEVFIDALQGVFEAGADFSAFVYGSPTDPASQYAHDVRNRAAVLAAEGVLTMREGVTNADAARLFGESGIYVNLTPSGSFDKTIGEAMAAGCLVIACNDAVRSALAPGLFVRDISAKPIADAIKGALSMPLEERSRYARQGRSYIEQEHSLSLLARRLMPYFEIVEAKRAE